MKLYFRKEFALATTIIVAIVIVLLDLVFVYYWVANDKEQIQIRLCLLILVEAMCLLILLEAIVAVFAFTLIHETARRRARCSVQKIEQNIINGKQNRRTLCW